MRFHTMSDTELTVQGQKVCQRVDLKAGTVWIGDKLDGTVEQRGNRATDKGGGQWGC